jgi:2-dehydro-3-deoxy-D-arabinonate dehydratase
MHIVRFIEGNDPIPRLGLSTENGSTYQLPIDEMATLLTMRLADIRDLLLCPGKEPVPGPITLLPPVSGLTEVWASGVTYLRSQEARIEESSVSDVYARIYDASRPELFFKSVAWRVVGDGEKIGIRTDSELNVPEPELALILNRFGETVGYSVCDDVSSRSIEGENPLYLPQAKIYAGACGLGPGIRPVWEVPRPDDLGIRIKVERSGQDVWVDQTSTAKMHRNFDELVDSLFFANSFPQGAILSTGTGLVPEIDFSLAQFDIVTVDIELVGSLMNEVAIGPAPFESLAPGLGTEASRPRATSQPDDISGKVVLREAGRPGRA